MNKNFSKKYPKKRYSTMNKKKEVTGWAVFDSNGNVVLTSICKSKNECIESLFGTRNLWEWAILKRNGWTCRKVLITEY